MKNKKFIVKISAVLATAALAFSGCQSSEPSAMTIQTTENNTIVVTAENARKNSGGVGYLTLEDGQSVVADAELTENSSINFRVMTEEENVQTLVDCTVTGEETADFALPAGEYVVAVTADKDATGSMTIYAE